MATYNFLFGTIEVVAAEQMQWGVGRNVAIHALGHGAPSTQVLGDSAKILRIVGYYDKNVAGDFRIEIERDEPILLEGESTTNPLGDMYTSNKVYIHPIRLTHVSSDIIDYRAIELSMAVLGDTTNYRRCTKFFNETYPNTFDLSGSIAVDAPVGAATISANLGGTITRITSGGTVRMVTAPITDEIVYDVTEANIRLGNVTVTKSGLETNMHSNLISLTSRQDEASAKGDFDLKVYDGAWTTAGTISVAFKSSSGTNEFFTTKAPNIWPLFRRRNKQRETLYVKWPSTATNNYKAFAHMTMWRAKPYFLTTLSNYGDTVTECQIKVSPAGSFRYLTRGDGSILDATSGALTGTFTADDDIYHFTFLHTESPMTATGTILGFARMKKADCNFIYTDAGAQWSDLTIHFDNLSIDRSEPFPHIVVMGFKQNNAGTTAAHAANESLVDLNAYQTITQVT